MQPLYGISALTGVDIAKLERIQKTALHVILSEDDRSYSSALRALGLQKLSERRRQLCLNFAKKAEKNPKFTNGLNQTKSYQSLDRNSLNTVRCL